MRVQEFLMKSFGVAVAGTGFIGPVHVEALRRIGQRVVGILGSTVEKSRASAAALGIPRGYADYAELLADAAVDAVHLATPNAAHFDQCRLALAAGKHIVCEKPLAMDSIQTAELVRRAARSARVAAVNYNIRFYPLVLESRERVRAGLVGDILHVTGSYQQDWLLNPNDFNWRVRAEHGGPLRAVADIGTHWIDTVCFVAGLEIESVCADLQTVHAVRTAPRGGSETFSNADRTDGAPVAIDTEDAGHVLVRFRGGARGCFAVSQTMAGRKNALRFDLAGSKASLSWDSEEPNALAIGHRDRPNERLIRDPALMTPPAAAHASYPGGHAEGFPDTFKQLYRAIYHDLEHGRSSEPAYATFADGHREVRICEAILASHRERRWIDV
jgi:predicted dehydrogenase